jgi:hypothetical protein
MKKEPLQKKLLPPHQRRGPLARRDPDDRKGGLGVVAVDLYKVERERRLREKAEQQVEKKERRKKEQKTATTVDLSFFLTCAARFSRSSTSSRMSGAPPPPPPRDGAAPVISEGVQRRP